MDTPNNEGKSWTPEDNLKILEELEKTFRYNQMIEIMHKKLGRTPIGVNKQIKKLVPKNINIKELHKGNLIHLARYKNFVNNYRILNNLN